MKFREFLKEKLKDTDFEKRYYRDLEKTRIAVEIVYFREKKGLTQAELAKLVNTSQSAIARLENPDYKGYSIATLRKVADAVGLELVVSFREKGVESNKKIPKLYTPSHEIPAIVAENYKKSRYNKKSHTR
jgi:transcriptional regulator with XRE-family HTH domain